MTLLNVVSLCCLMKSQIFLVKLNKSRYACKYTCQHFSPSLFLIFLLHGLYTFSALNFCHSYELTYALSLTQARERERVRVCCFYYCFADMVLVQLFSTASAAAIAVYVVCACMIVTALLALVVIPCHLYPLFT